MQNNTFFVLSPGIARQCFTAAIMAWVEPPGQFTPIFSTQDSTEEFWVCQQACGVHWEIQGDTLGKGRLTSYHFCYLLPLPFLYVF
jgi:hypothetical protein